MFENIFGIIERVFIVSERYQFWLTGLRNTLIIASFALLLGLALGLLFAMVRVVYDTSAKPSIPLRLVNRVVKIYVTIIRGTPMMVQLLIMNFIILAASRNQLLIGILAFGFNSAAYAAEIFRGGILSIDKGQTEAGRSLGLGYAQTMLKVILPQAFKNSLPALGNEFITVLKETSLAGTVAIIDITRAGTIIRGLTFDPTPLIFVALIYLILVMFLEFIFGIAERRMRKSDNR